MSCIRFLTLSILLPATSTLALNVLAPEKVCVVDKWAVSASSLALAITPAFHVPVPIVPTVVSDVFPAVGDLAFI